jgi:hypothetical protein
MKIEALHGKQFVKDKFIPQAKMLEGLTFVELNGEKEAFSRSANSSQ